MTSWENFSYLHEMLVQYYFGSDIAFTLFILLVFFIWMIAAGMDLRYAIAFTLPLAGGLSIAGWLGDANWVMNLILVVAAAVYGYVLLKILT